MLETIQHQLNTFNLNLSFESPVSPKLRKTAKKNTQKCNEIFKLS